jgi:hypothetical protein
MDKKIAGLLGAVGALASLNTAQAATPPDSNDVLKAGSYADLLQPIPNAAEKLQAVDETQGVAPVQTAQLVIEGRHHHHHHHHHAYHRDRRIVVRPRRHHHHHHHHHHGIIIR